MKKLLTLIYSVTAYLIGSASLVYLIAFIFNIYVPVSIDSGSQNQILVSALINLSLIALFGLQHSIMARRSFKKMIELVIPSQVERSTFLLVTALIVFIICYFWQPIPIQIWNFDASFLGNILLAIGLLGWALVFYTTFLISHWDLFGLRQAWLYFRSIEYTPVPFKDRVLYRYIRHPMMTGVFLGIWFTPSMSIGHLVFALGFTAYVFIGVYYEEKDLIADFGKKYLDYKRITGKFIPSLQGS